MIDGVQALRINALHNTTGIKQTAVGWFPIALRPRNQAGAEDLVRMTNNKGHGIVRDARGEDQPKDKQRAQQSSKTPAAGPHAKPELTDNSKTPGAGTLPEPGKSDDSTSG